MRTQEIRVTFDPAPLVGTLARLRGIVEIAKERDRQESLWGDQSHLTPERRFAILAEEFGEVAKEIVEHDPAGNLRTELVQTAAVCLAWLEVLP